MELRSMRSTQETSTRDALEHGRADLWQRSPEIVARLGEIATTLYTQLSADI
jgi:hypothetical protein